MTSRRTLSYAVSLTNVHKWGTATRVLDLIASQTENLDRVIELSLRDMAEWLGLSMRSIQVQTGKLIGWGMLEKVSRGRGTAGNRWRIVDPVDWAVDVPWAIDRRDVIVHLAAFSWLTERALEGDSARTQERALALLRRGKVQQKIEGSASSARVQPRALEAPTARTQARAQASSIHYSLLSSKELSLEGESEGAATKAERLIAAAERGTGASIFGVEFRKRLSWLAIEANGHYDDLLRVAADPSGPKSIEIRIQQLERTLTTPQVEKVDPAVMLRADLRVQLADLEDAQRAGLPGAEAEAETLRQQLSSLEA